jgi:hypothetical protein
VAIDRAGGKIYWADAGAEKISFANLDGSGAGGDLDTTGATVEGPVGVAIDPMEGKIYWANSSVSTGNKISFANLDGTGGGGDLDTTGATVSSPHFLAILTAPGGSGAPVITGTGEVGQQFSCDQGSWAQDLPEALLYRAPRTFAYQWQLGGSDIGGATTSTYTPTAPGTYTCRVTASNEAGSTSQTSAAVQVSAPPTPPPTPSPIISPPAIPSNAFTIGALKGTKLTLNVPGAGQIDLVDAASTAGGKGASAAKARRKLKPSSARASGPGSVIVTLRLTKAAKKLLRQKGKLKVSVAATFTPDGGTPNTQTVKGKVKKSKK